MINTDIEKRLDKIENKINSIIQMLDRLNRIQIADGTTSCNFEILNVKQVAEFCNLETNSIYAMCARGDIPFFKIGKGYRFRKSEIMVWFQGKQQQISIPVDQYVDSYLQTQNRKL